jgi:hypothetical protein
MYSFSAFMNSLTEARRKRSSSIFPSLAIQASIRR